MPRQPPLDAGLMSEKRIGQVEDDGSILAADVPPVPKPRSSDSVGGTRDAPDFMHQIEGGLQAGSGRHERTIGGRQRGTVGDGAVADHRFARMRIGRPQDQLAPGRAPENSPTRRLVR